MRSMLLLLVALGIVSSALRAQTTAGAVFPDHEFTVLFDGTNLEQWTGNKNAYRIINGELTVVTEAGESGGNLYTVEEYKDFIFRFEFKLSPGANNGLGIRTPTKGDAAYHGMELQILDNTAKKYENLKTYQYHGSIYGVVPALRGYLKPVGEWNTQIVIAKGDHITVILNETVILDATLTHFIKNNRTIDGKDHPGLGNKKGHVGFLGHGDPLWFRNIAIKKI